MRKTRLKRKTPLRKVNKKRKAERFRKTFGPAGYADFVRSLPCIACGMRGGRIAVHHDPTRGAGGRWVDTSPLCKSTDYGEGCHERRHRLGVETFWREVGMTFGDAARLTQSKWLAR